MGIFFRPYVMQAGAAEEGKMNEKPEIAKEITEQPLNEVFSRVIWSNLQGDFDDYTAALAKGIISRPSRRLYWGRMCFAIAITAAIALAGIFCEVKGIIRWSTAMLHAFEVTIGAFVGILVGESASHKEVASYLPPMIDKSFEEKNAKD